MTAASAKIPSSGFRMVAGVVSLLVFFKPPARSAVPDPPNLAPGGGAVVSPARVSVSHPDPSAAIYFTMDGTDPRAGFGRVSSTARRAGAFISVNRPLVIRARARTAGDWSSMVTAAYSVDKDFSHLLITEFMYHPQGSSDDAEFVEFANVGHSSLDLAGLFLREGEDEGWTNGFYHFQTGARIDPGQFLLLARRASVFGALYPGIKIHGETQSRFNNSSASIRLESADRALATHAAYASAAPWQVVPDNHGYFAQDAVGFSLVRRTLSPSADPTHHSSWRTSARPLGSPGQNDPAPSVLPVYVNELMTRGTGAHPDFVEFYNPNTEPVDLGGWWLSDERNFPFRYSIPAGTVVPAGGYLALSESQYSSGVSFSGEGERCYLFSAESDGTLTGFSHGFQFSGSARSTSFGRHVSSDGSESFPLQAAPTPGSPNSGPAVPPIIISEISHNPADPHHPFIELYNRSSTDVPLFELNDTDATWALGSDVFYPVPLPPGLVVRAHGCLVVVLADPQGFRQFYQVPEDAPVIAVPDAVWTLRPGLPLVLFKPEGRNRDIVRHMAVEYINWDQSAPWPTGTDAPLQSLQRANPASFANDAAHWRTFPTRATPGRPNIENLPPQIDAGGPYQAFTSRDHHLSALVEDDHWDGLPPTLTWSQISGPSPAEIDPPTASAPRVRFPQPGTYSLRIHATDGQASTEATAAIEVIDGGFEAWRDSHFPPELPASPQNGHPDADPDGDGLSNVVEYVFDSSPTHPSPAPRLDLQLAQNNWQLTWTQRQTTKDTTVTVEVANHLPGPWRHDPAFFHRSESTQGQSTTITVSEKSPHPTQSQVFIRLRCHLR